jgi:hypothetical protein
MANVWIGFKDGTFKTYKPLEHANFYAKDVDTISHSEGTPEEEIKKSKLAFGAMEDFLKENKNFLKDYQTDFTVWDKLMVFLHPGKPFTWIAQEAGSFFFLLYILPGSNGREEASFTTMLQYFKNNHAPETFACLLWDPEEEKLNRVPIDKAVSIGLDTLRKARKTRC